MSAANETQQKVLECREAVKEICCGHLHRHGVYIEIPTAVFFDEHDRDAIVPPLAFYNFQKGKIELMRPPEQPWTVREALLVSKLWIREEDLIVIRRIADQKLLASSGVMVQLPVEERMGLLRESALVAVDEMFEHPSPEKISRSQEVVGSFVKVLMQDPSAYLVLARLSSHDPYTLQHSVGTSVNSIVLAKKVGFTNEDDLLAIGMAGLLHDIGKVKVDRNLINKQGPLGAAEWEVMKKHPAAGYELVKDNPELSEDMKRAILEHHEDIVGTGYPRGLKREQLGRFTQIVSICDKFNAMTTDRSYSKARTVYDALEVLKDKMSEKLDQDLFSQLVLVYGGKI